MTANASRLLRMISLGVALAACGGGDGVVGLKQDPNDLFWSLELNQNAINLSTDQSQPQFHTFQLVATAYRLDGTPIVGAGTPTFVTTDTNKVKVDATGLLTAKAVTNPTSPTHTPIRIFVSMSGNPGPVTNADTAFVIVTSTVRPIANFSITPNRTSFGVGYDTILAARATNAAGAAVTGMQISYSSSAPKVASYDATGLMMPMTMGSTKLRARTMNYGVEHRDSVDLTITEPVVFHVDIGYFQTPTGASDTFFNPVELTIKAGQGVSWGSKNAISATITFEDPTNVGPSPVDGMRGNIPNFFPIPPQRKIRMFNVPGTYNYRDAAPGKTAVGRIIVTP